MQRIGRHDWRSCLLSEGDGDAIARRGTVPPSLGPLSIHSIHVSALEGLRPIRKGPFDRMVLAPAYAEGMTLRTANAMLAKYPGDVRKV